MRKRDCMKTLNEMLTFLMDHECFESICRGLDVQEEELELVLASIITDIDNDDCDSK